MGTLPETEIRGQIRAYLRADCESPPPDVHFHCDLCRSRAVSFFEKTVYTDGVQAFRPEQICQDLSNAWERKYQVLIPLCFAHQGNFRPKSSFVDYDEGRRRLWIYFKSQILSKIMEE